MSDFNSIRSKFGTPVKLKPKSLRKSPRSESPRTKSLRRESPHSESPTKMMEKNYQKEIEERYNQINPWITSKKYDKNKDDKNVEKLREKYLLQTKGGFTQRKRSRGKSSSKRVKKQSKRSRRYKTKNKNKI